MRQDADRDVIHQRIEVELKDRCWENYKSHHESGIDVNMNIHDKLFRKILRKKGSSVSGFAEYLSEKLCVTSLSRIVYQSTN